MSESQLVQALKQLRKGDGLTLGSIAMIDDVEEVFGTNDYVAIRQAILDALEREQSDKCVRALANAFGIGADSGTNLTERRETYVASNRLAMRTVTNYEDFGALVLSQLIQLPVASTFTEVDILLSVVEDMIHHALSRDAEGDGLFDRDRLTTILDKIERLYDAEDTLITEAHHTRLRALLDQFQAKHFELRGHGRQSLGINEHDREVAG